MSEDVAGLLEEPASENAVLARVLRHVQDKPVCPRPEDFWTALKRFPELVVRLSGDRPGEPELPMDWRHRRGAAECTHEHRDREVTGRKQFVDAVADATSVEVVHHDDSHFDEDPEPDPAVVRADGSGVGDVELDDRTEAELDLDVLVSLYRAVDWTVVPGIETQAAAQWATRLQQARDRLDGEPWTCPHCGAESHDPESQRVAGTAVVRVTCPECEGVEEIPQESGPPRGPRHDELMTDGGASTSEPDRSPGWICTGCKKAITSRPAGPCHDCGGHFRPATEEDLACDRCGDDDGRRLLDRRGEFDRLCPGCIDEVIR